MKTPNTLHETRCSKCNDGTPAIVTIPCPGDEPKGYCMEHLIEHEIDCVNRQAADALMDAVLASLEGTSTT